jgi:hypothetical protein
MAWITIRYSAGNEHNPANPWGRNELVIHADGTARLDHHPSRGGEPRAWAGHVAAPALDELMAALGRAGFPAVPGTAASRTAAIPPDTILRRLAVEADGETRQALVSWNHAPSLPGYAEAFDIIDAVIRQLSSDALRPTKDTADQTEDTVDQTEDTADQTDTVDQTGRGQIVHGAVAVQP